MSVLIKGMEMPALCQECDLYIDGACYAKGYRDYRSIMDTSKPADCPLTEIPTPHGRLGDLDALVKTLEQNRLCYVSDIDDESFELGTNRAIDAVRNADTIIEAEE